MISICSNNQNNTCVPFIASQFLGCKVSPFSPDLPKEDIKHVMNLVKPAIVFTSNDAIETISNVKEELNLQTEIVLFGNDDKHTSFSKFLEFTQEANEFKPVEIKSLTNTAVIMFSSGTTGLPKGICLNHYGLSCQAKNMQNFAFLTEDSYTFKLNDKSLQATNVHLNFAGIYWISPIICLIISAIFGYCRLLCPKYEPREAWKLIEKWKVSTLFLPPHRLYDMIRLRPNEPVDISSLRCVRLAGSSISKERILKVRRDLQNVVVKQGCGQTEISGTYADLYLKNPKDFRFIIEKPDSIGRPVKGITYKVTDLENGEALGPNKPGELRLKTKFQMNGYLNLDSSSCWDEDGFFKTGDVVYYDEDYSFYIVDRIKEIFKYKSWNVAPAALEAILLEHPAVLQAVVVGMPHSEDSHHPCAFVVVRKDLNVNADEILNYVNEKVEDRKKLRGGVHIIEKLPITPSGKLKRNYLRDILARNLVK